MKYGMYIGKGFNNKSIRRKLGAIEKVADSMSELASGMKILAQEIKDTDIKGAPENISITGCSFINNPQEEKEKRKVTFCYDDYDLMA